jgi:hypothetical protein
MKRARASAAMVRFSVESRAVGLFKLRSWNFIVGAVEASFVVEVGPVGGRELDINDGAIRALVGHSRADVLGFREAVDAHHEGVIVWVTKGPDRGQDLLKAT